MVLGVPDMAAVMAVLHAFRDRLALQAFEFFSEQALGRVLEHHDLQRPFETPHALLRPAGVRRRGRWRRGGGNGVFRGCLQAGRVEDGVISQSLSQAESLWRLREDISETISRWTPYKNDISTTVSRVPDLLSEVEEIVSANYPEFEIIWFGHIGDGNVHLNILKPDDLSQEQFQQRCGEVSELVFEVVARHGGSVSAEHGVGLLKKPYLRYSRSAAELSLMRGIRRVFDPAGILNPGNP
jgi:FAD/FMN-containing dehydrogenase